MDPETFRAQSRERWERAAAGWSAVRDAHTRDTAPVTERLLDDAAVGPGMTVLDVAAGPGAVGLAAARRVGPSGKVIVTDGAEAMVATAAGWAAELGLGDVVETRAMEAEWLDLPAASVDAVVCRWALMLLADPEAGLREMRRVLRSERRVAVAVWDRPEANQWFTRPQRLLLDRGAVPPPSPGEPGPFALADAERLEELLWGAGLTGVRVEAVDFEWHADSLEAWFEHTRSTSTTVAAAVADMAPADHYAFRDDFDAAFAEFVGADGRVAIPARALVGSGEA